jgi:hypothetical protein
MSDTELGPSETPEEPKADEEVKQYKIRSKQYKIRSNVRLYQINTKDISTNYYLKILRITSTFVKLQLIFSLLYGYKFWTVNLKFHWHILDCVIVWTTVCLQLQLINFGILWISWLILAGLVLNLLCDLWIVFPILCQAFDVIGITEME